MSRGLDSNIQGLVLAMDSGLFGGIIKWLAILTTVVTVAALQISPIYFKGLSEKEGMEQASIAREFASGNGYTAKSIRPLAIWQLQSNGRNVPQVNFPETYHAPLNSMVNSIPLWLAKRYWALPEGAVVYPPDRVIAATSMLLFILSVFVWYLIALRLFDNKLAIVGGGLLVVSDIFWQFSMSGLPHMLLLFLFSITALAMMQAIFARQSNMASGVWLSLFAAGSALMVLTQPLTVWLFIGSLLFIFFYFRPRFFITAIVSIVFLLVVSPWLIRNFQVCGNPFGLAMFSILDGVRGSEDVWMRSMDPNFGGIRPGEFRTKLENNFTLQMGHMFKYFGFSIIAPAFFLCLLHNFKKAERAHFRWYVLTAWLGAFIGMLIYGTPEEMLGQNQLHVLFLPIMTYYGLAFILVLWSRLPIDYRFIRMSFFAVLYMITALPLILNLLPNNRPRLHWPPYVPPFINILGQWYQQGEILVSDMPWAVAWYANRKCLLLPSTPEVMLTINDYNQLGGPVSGLYLTPITSRRGFFNEIANGEYREWAPFILRSVNLENFFLRTATVLPIDGECIIFSDRVRWQAAETQVDTAELTGQATDDEDEEEAAE